MVDFKNIKNEVDSDFNKEMEEMIIREIKKQYRECLYDNDSLVSISFCELKDGIKKFIIENINEFDFEVNFKFNDSRLEIYFYPMKQKNVVIENNMKNPKYRVREMYNLLEKIMI